MVNRARDETAAFEASLETTFESLFEQHWERVCGVLYRLLGDWDEAQDLALETFWQLYRNPPRDNSRPAGWLYRVATNLGLNALRGRSRRSHYEEQAGKLEFQAAPNAPSLDPAVAMEQAERRQHIRSVLAEMKDRSARLLILRYSGLSYSELAAALDLNPASIGALLARAEREFAQQYNRLTE